MQVNVLDQYSAGRSHQQCPVCGETSFWVAPTGDFGKCYRPACSHTEKQKDEQTGSALWGLFLQSREALLTQIERDEKKYSDDHLTGWGFLKKRGVNKEAINLLLVGVVPPGGFEWEGGFSEKMQAKELQLIETCTKKAGWVAFWYTDENNKISSLELRSTIAIGGKKQFRSWKLGQKRGLFGAHFREGDGAKHAFGKEAICIESTIGLCVAQSMCLDDFGNTLSLFAVGGSSGEDMATLKKVTETAKKKFFFCDNDKPGMKLGKRILYFLQYHLMFSVYRYAVMAY